MPNVEVRGRYRAFTYDGTTSLDFTTYANSLCVIRRPNEISFVTLRQYIPGISTPFTTFEPGSAYVVVSREGNANFDMGPYTRIDRLPSTLNVRSPQYYLGLDKNSITIPLSVYALSINTPLSSVTGITYVNGVGASQRTVTVDQIRGGFETEFTHFLPNSGYQLRTRIPFTFFAPLQSEMGDAYAWGENNGAFGMGYYFSPYSAVSAQNIYGLWDKIAVGGANIIFEDLDTGEYISSNFVLALSACGNVKKLFVTGSNNLGQLGTGDNKNRFTWTAISGEWSDIAVGESTSYALSTNGKLFSTGNNGLGQTGITTDVAVLSVTNFTQESLNGTWSQIAAGGQCLLALSANGKLFGCGINSSGQLGLGHNDTKVYTLTQEANNGYYAKIYTNGTSSYTLYYGTLRGCGYNYNGELGTGDNVSKNTFVPEVCGLNVTDVFVGNATFIRTGENYLRGAGYNPNNRRLILTNSNNNTRRNTFEPTLIPNTIKTMVFRLEGGGMNNFFTIDSNNQLITYRRYTSLITENLGINYFNIFSNNDYNSNVIIGLSARNDLRPTPTPTVTPITPTPTRTPPPTPTPSITPTRVVGGVLQKMAFLAQTGSDLRSFREIQEYTNDLSTLTRITVNPYSGSFQSQMVMAYENGAHSNLIAVITTPSDLARYVRRWNGSLWEVVANDPPTLRVGGSYSSNGADVLFIDKDNVYHYYHYNSAGTSMNVCTSNDRGATWSTAKQVSPSNNARNYFNSPYTPIVAAQYNLAGYSGSHKMVYTASDGIYGYGNADTTAVRLYTTSPSTSQYDYNDNKLGVYHMARIVNFFGSYRVYLDETSIYSDASIATDYSTGSIGGFLTDARSPLISINFSNTDSNIVYIAYLKKTASFKRGGIGFIEYNKSTNTVISNTVIATTQGASLGGITFNPSLASDIVSLKLFILSDNSLGIFVNTFEGSPNFRNSYHILKRNLAGVWSYASGPTYITVPDDTNYTTFATRIV